MGDFFQNCVLCATPDFELNNSIIVWIKGLLATEFALAISNTDA